MCFEPFTPSRKYGVEFPERSDIRFRKSVGFTENNGFKQRILFINQNNQDTKIFKETIY